MTWQLAAFAIVAAILGCGWLAYERRRPSARLAAVVAVMAALAALGRDAFAALPDVKPITAMTFVVGYALGPLPGFTVGALGMLVSNFMLGQGPYTPWQMAAWGIVGLAGAAARRLAGPRLGRVGLATGCALAALVAKQIMNLYTWTLGGVHTPAAFVLIAGQALPYDITDIVASFLFGLAFAPELTRILTRSRLRMEVSWESHGASGAPPPGTAAQLPPGRRAVRRAWAWAGAGAAGVAIALGTVALLEGPHPARASAQASRSHATGAAAGTGPEIAYLRAAQNADGGFGAASGQASSELYTAWAAIGLAAAGRDPLSLVRNGHTLLDALRGEAATLQGAGDLERTILALHACGASAHALPGGDPVARLLRMRARDGSFGGLANLSAFAVLALRAAGYPPSKPVLAGAARWLSAQQNADGGFGYGPRGGASDVDDTAAALQALAAVHPGSSALARATRYLLRAQNPDGGYPQQPGGSSNAQSTAWAIEGLTAAGRHAERVTRAGSRSPVAYLRTLVTPEGSVRYSRTGEQTPVWVTAQALTGLAAKPLPVAPVAH
jgi:energy-coupling factor transport system substrate-specific component